ncbi:MAG: hypothetical protein Q605_AUC00851G0001 [Actinomyces urogenitalis DORA_12]|jgi:hypothetical protein|uniref:Uncharacterized protein n=1 Tax=Actinomyces urogenitalis DORA_12 TaxID=1403939 RepID=W1VH45_9ACTO|nr:MAG: hypothetical protein Q605_AUC00851G0001 [Actinomyces urogenitalis DORA_12]
MGFRWSVVPAWAAWRGATVASGADHVAVLAQGAQVGHGVVLAAFDVVDVAAGLAAHDAGVVVACEDSGADAPPVSGQLCGAPGSRSG